MFKIEEFFKNKSINHIHKIGIIFIASLTLIFTFVLLYNTYSEYAKDLEEIEIEYIDKQKKFIKEEVSRALNYIQYKYKKDRLNKSVKELTSEIVDAIEQMRNERDGTGYIFIYDFDGINIADPILKENAGKNLIDFTDKNGKKVIKELIDISKQQDGGYVEYVWNKPTTHQMAPKISYAVAFEPLNWMIGTGVYLDDVEVALNERKQEYYKKIEKYIVEVFIFATVLFMISSVVYRYFTILISEDLKLIQDKLNSFSKIDGEKIHFREFQYISTHVNSMRDELQDLNKNLEEKVKQRTKKVKKSEQFTKKLLRNQDEFIRTSIHEINTPLSIIITNIDLFKMKLGENKYLSKIEAGSKIIHNIYNDLSYMIKKDKITYPKEKINFTKTIQDRVDFFEEVAIGNSIQMKSNLQNDIICFFNEIELQRIIDNSISNAIKYSYTDETVNINLSADDQAIYLEIINIGDTIENPDKLFKKYYRENKSRGGFGLGLNIIKNICMNNNVKIDLSSQDHKTTFKYIFTKGANANTTS